MNGICEQGHVTNFYGGRGFKLKDARCGQCGGPVAGAKFVCCERCTPADPRDRGQWYTLRLSAKACPAGHPLAPGRVTTAAESLALEARDLELPPAAKADA